MEQATFEHLRAHERPKDERDFLLGSVQAPTAIPASFLPDNSWLKRNFQGKTPWCGEHMATHFQAILQHVFNPQLQQRYTPRFSAVKIKKIDGFPLDAGTDMRSIFKSLKNDGVDDFEPLENDVTLPLAAYANPAVITPAMDANATTKKIASYAFGNTDFGSLCQHIYQNKAVLLLIKCDDGFWGTPTPTFATPKYGHFVVADGYSTDGIRIIDSADPNDTFSIKMIAKQYIRPEFILESGTAVDMAAVTQAVQQVVTQASSIVTQINNAPDMPHPQKLSLLQELAEGLKLVEGFFQRS
jgi:hypothetical protein